jgi:hypothetical protein
MNPKVKKVLDKINNEGIDSVLPFFNDNFEIRIGLFEVG